MKKIISFLSLVILFSFFVIPAHAAAPDGLGPWADFVQTSSQANTKGGTPVSTVNPARSNPTNAVGIAEDNTVDSSFFSLGFGGSITLGFINGISSGVVVVEATNPNYPVEKAKVEVSSDGISFVTAGNITQDGTVNVPSGIGCAKFVRITDISNPNDFTEDTADAYDVDGVMAQGEACQLPTNTPTPSPKPGCIIDIKVANKAKIVNKITTNSNTGGNTSSFNTLGGSVVTGKATSTTSIKTAANTNKITITQDCCSVGGSAKNTNTGPGSINIARIN